ncbi:MAG: TetR/AcrR family transcriptional regulator [Bacteroidales bacterium]|nr:TetR/AcrR family transcriptional regulator [Bacteroidales bacterium]
MDDKHGDFLLKVYELFNRYGIKSVTMDDVAHELSISKKTLYECIQDKSELVKHVMEMTDRFHSMKLKEITDRNLNALDELFEINQYMTHMVSQVNPSLGYDMKKYYPEIYKSIMLGQRQRLHNAILSNLSKGLSEGLYREDIDAEIISRLHMTRMESYHHKDGLGLTDLNPPEVTREIFIYHVRGIASHKGIEQLDKKLNSDWK